MPRILRRNALARYALGFLALGAVGLSEVAEPAAFAAPSPASASGLRQSCTSQILAPPRVISAVMKKPGNEYQSIDVRLQFAAVDPACAGHFRRAAAVRSALIRQGHRVNEDAVWDPILYGGEANNEARAALYTTLNSHQVPQLYFQSGDRVQFKLRLQVTKVATGKVIKSLVTTHPVQVQGR